MKINEEPAAPLPKNIISRLRWHLNAQVVCFKTYASCKSNSRSPLIVGWTFTHLSPDSGTSGGVMMSCARSPGCGAQLVPIWAPDILTESDSKTGQKHPHGGPGGLLWPLRAYCPRLTSVQLLQPPNILLLCSCCW